MHNNIYDLFLLDRFKYPGYNVSDVSKIWSVKHILNKNFLPKNILNVSSVPDAILTCIDLELDIFIIIIYTVFPLFFNNIICRGIRIPRKRYGPKVFNNNISDNTNFITCQFKLTINNLFLYILINKLSGVCK